MQSFIQILTSSFIHSVREGGREGGGEDHKSSCGLRLTSGRGGENERWLTSLIHKILWNPLLAEILSPMLSQCFKASSCCKFPQVHFGLPPPSMSHRPALDNPWWRWQLFKGNFSIYWLLLTGFGCQRSNLDTSLTLYTFPTKELELTSDSTWTKYHQRL